MMETNFSFCEKQLISGELFSTVLQDSQFRKNMVFALKFAKDLFRLHVVKARLVRTVCHVWQMFVFRMRKKNYSFFHDIYISLIKVIKVRN